MEKFIHNGGVLPLCKLSSRSDEAGTNALTALLHLSSRGMCANQCIEDMIDAGSISRMAEIAMSSMDECPNDLWRTRMNLSLALLTNMTRTERGAVELCGRSLPDEAIPWDPSSNGHLKAVEDGFNAMQLPEKPTMTILLSKFLTLSIIRDGNQSLQLSFEEASASINDPYQHFATILMNVTQLERGRMYLMRQKEGHSILQTVLSQLRSKNPVRRQGIAGVVKNCCFEKESAWWLLNQVNILKHLLYPLAGPEELDLDEKFGMDPDLWLEGPEKQREPDHATRLLLVESILLLCATGKQSRQSIRVARSYVILKLADMVEESEDISEKINEIVQFIRRDEQGEDEGSSDRFMQELYRVDHHILASSTFHDNYDHVD